MLLTQTMPYIMICVQTRWLGTILKMRWMLATLAVGGMITVGAIGAETYHAFVLNHEKGDTMAREREIRHNEPQLGEAFRPHSWYAGEA